MEIKADLCIGCGQCVIVCPVQAIKLIDSIAVINKNLCVECSICKRNADCPVNAIRSRRLKWPRVIRSPFSDVISTHKITGIPGRGTEEMKTNDVTNRFDVDEIGFTIEIGRPGVGTHLGNIELFTTKLISMGVKFEEESPVSALLIDDNGHIKKDIKEEHVLSAIIEFKVPINKATLVMQVIKQIEKNIDTAFTVGIISQVMKDGTIPILDLLTQQGFSVRPNAKVNIALGKV